MIKINTPVESYYLEKPHLKNSSSKIVYVKREDLCAPKGTPPFSKTRGLYKHLLFLKSKGIIVVGYVETSISMAGWGVSWLAQELGMKAVIFNPVYKVPHPDTDPVLNFHREKWKEFGAEIIGIKAGMAKVNWNICNREMRNGFVNRYSLLPLGLPLRETIDETAEEAKRMSGKYASIVVSIGSGTICSGLVKAFEPPVEIYGIMCRKGDLKRKRNKILSSSFSFQNCSLHLIDLGYEYTEKAEIETPFPCNDFYDKKAWKWLTENYYRLNKPVLFWNIGSNAI